MAWSTRELAELAGTTVNTVRHYHAEGLLPEPERASNGYKRYGADHLIRLLRITRLRDLGVPLAGIAGMEQDPQSRVAEIRRLDREIAAHIDRLATAREDLARILEHDAPATTPTGFADLAPRLSAAQQDLLAVYATVFDEETVEQFHRALQAPEETDELFEDLPADASAEQIEQLARRLVPVMRRQRAQFPRLHDPGVRRGVDPLEARRTMGHALVEVYHPAQVRVLQRLDALLEEAERG